MYFSHVSRLVAIPRHCQSSGPPSDPGRVLADPPTGGVTSPCLHEDELELFFESLGNIWSATRASLTIPFENAQPISGISTQGFVEERPFLSADGLSLYFSRFRATPAPMRKIFVSRRVSRDQPFLGAEEIGIDGLEFFEGALGSVGGDDLTLYLEIVQESDPSSGIPQHTDIAFATRTTTTETLRDVETDV